MDSRSAQLREFIHKYSAPHSLIALEAQLARSGLLPLLEENGVLPVVVSPNPHHPEEERMEHERWWNDNPNARAAYHRLRVTRETAFMLIQLGIVVGDMASALPKPK